MIAQVKALTAFHGERRVLDEVSFELRPGRVRVVLGPNGAGKSTLLRSMLGIHRDVRGEVLLDGQSTRKMGPRRVAQKVAWVPQHFDDSSGFTVLEVVLMGRTPHGGLFALTSRADEARAKTLLGSVGMAGFERRRIDTLSGGEQRMVLLVRALMQSPALLLLDEPTAFLDLRHQVTLLRQLRAYASQGMAVLAVLHDVNLTAAYADDVLLLKAGKVVADGDRQTVLTPPALEALYELPLVRGEVEGQALFAPRMS